MGNLILITLGSEMANELGLEGKFDIDHSQE